jgi:hypothetical protein
MAKPAKLIALSRLSLRHEVDPEKRHLERGQEFKTDLRTEKEVNILLATGAVALPDSPEAKTAIEDYDVAQRVAAVRAQRAAAADAAKKEK